MPHRKKPENNTVKRHRLNPADTVTLLRLFASPLLLLAKPLTAPFFAIWLFLGASDAADGMLARRLNMQSTFGARLDTLADIVFFAAAAMALWPTLQPQTWMIVCAALTAAVRGASALTLAVRFGRPTLLHTYLNKTAGFLLFCLPVMQLAFGGAAALCIVCAAAAISAAEELIIVLCREKFEPDIKGLLFKHQDL